MSDRQLNLSMPVYDQSAFAVRYSELAQYKVPIPPDAFRLGYDGLNALFSRIQQASDRVLDIHAEAVRLHSESEAVALATKAAYDAKRAVKIAQYGQGEYESFKVLEARVHQELADDIRLMRQAEITQGLFAAYLKTVESTVTNLKSARRTLEQQSENYRRQVPSAAVVPQAQRTMS